MKKPSQLERYFKGAANGNRISILVLISKNEGLTVEEISENLKIDFKNVSQHTRRLVLAGLLDKQHEGRSVRHFLSPYGEKFVKFLKSF